MIIKSIRVQNFCCILEETLNYEPLTALVGPNGCGKSSFLRAFELFYATNPRLSAEDFYAGNSTRDIEITITYTGFDEEEIDHFNKYVENGELTVVRVFSLTDGKISAKLHGSLLQNPDFASVRTLGGAREITAAYNALREDPQYSDLPSVRSKDAALEELRKWESAHPEECQRRRDEGQFFGFTEVAQGYLGRYTHFIPIHAVRDAADDASEGKGTVISQIMDLVVRSALAERNDIRALREETLARYEDIFAPEKLTELSELQDQLCKTPQTYVPDAKVSLSWQKGGEIEIPMPKAEVKLIEDGYPATVVRSGHGLQRAFILTMLQHLALARKPAPTIIENGDSGSVGALKKPRTPNLILGIEEPELYQHPNRQRYFARVLLALASGTIPGVSERTQVIYGTHSPLFVGLDRFDQVRLLRKVSGPEGSPKVTKVHQASLDEVAGQLWKAAGCPEPIFTGETLRPRLQAIMTPWMNEGFFSEVVVLVEGEGDRAAILATANSIGYDLESMGICVVPCMSKNNLDRPAVVFQTLGIQTYLIWDNDKNAQDPNPDENKRLLRLVGAAEEDWPVGVWNTHACLDCNLECSLRQEISPSIFDELFEEARSEFRMKKEQALKNPFALRRVIEKATAISYTSATLKAIVEKICGFRQMETPEEENLISETALQTGGEK